MSMLDVQFSRAHLFNHVVSSKVVKQLDPDDGADCRHQHRCHIAHWWHLQAGYDL